MGERSQQSLLTSLQPEGLETQRDRDPQWPRPHLPASDSKVMEMFMGAQRPQRSQECWVQARGVQAASRMCDSRHDLPVSVSKMITHLAISSGSWAKEAVQGRDGVKWC